MLSLHESTTRPFIICIIIIICNIIYIYDSVNLQHVLLLNNMIIISISSILRWENENSKW